MCFFSYFFSCLFWCFFWCSFSCFFWCFSSWFFSVFSGVFFWFARAFSRVFFGGVACAVVVRVFFWCFLCGLLFLVWVAKVFLMGWFIEFVIASVLKICALNHHGLLGNGTSFFSLFLVLFLVPFWCPLIQRMGGTQDISYIIYYKYIDISKHDFDLTPVPSSPPI